MSTNYEILQDCFIPDNDCGFRQVFATINHVLFSPLHEKKLNEEERKELDDALYSLLARVLAEIKQKSQECGYDPQLVFGLMPYDFDYILEERDVCENILRNTNTMWRKIEASTLSKRGVSKKLQKKVQENILAHNLAAFTTLPEEMLEYLDEMGVEVLNLIVEFQEFKSWYDRKYCARLENWKVTFRLA